MRSSCKLAFFFLLVAPGLLCSSAIAISPNTYYLDADTPATGSNLATTPLNTLFGTITFAGEIFTPTSNDPDFTAAGSTGRVFDVTFNTPAQLTFNFDVSAITFIYGGNVGVFDAKARDIHGVVVASFFQADTDDGQPAGPITLLAPGIRQLVWSDPMRTFAAIDNVLIEVSPVPEPRIFVMLITGSLLANLFYKRSR